MSFQLRQVEEQALRLSPEDRETLVDTLLHSLSLEPPTLTETDEAWMVEAERRFQALRSGQAKSIVGEQFFSEIRRELGWS